LKILVLNAGSSSMKYRLFDMPGGQLLCRGILERIGIEGTRLKHRVGDDERIVEAPGLRDHHQGVELIIRQILDPEIGVLKTIDEIGAVGHRTVHGGEMFANSVLIDESVISMIQTCIPLAPLHNPANLAGIEAAVAHLPNVPQVAVFDTAFHQTMPDYAYMYPLPYEFYEEYRLRRYGFHGTSHRYVSAKACEFLGVDIARMKMVTCHLGNGSSVAAVDGGRSVDTSMGFTPLEGLMMGTRCGDIDPSIHKFIIEKENIGIIEVDNILNKRSGLLGIGGVTSDIRDVLNAADAGNERARLALRMFCYRIKKYIGAYAAAMGGLDILVFTAGIGENNPPIRTDACAGLEFLGVKLDPARNEMKGMTGLISADNSRVKVLSVLTDEELVIASDTYKIVTNINTTD
jgi:acetate kinase